MNTITRMCVGAALLPAIFGQEGGVVFRSESRLVEVYATIFDGKGRYVDGLARERFELRDNGAPQPLVSFEAVSSEFACAVLLDTTGSMAHALPAIKNALVRMIDELRESDSMGIYSFSSSLRMLQDFTSDKAAAKRAVLRTRAMGGTALFDSLAQLSRDLSKRNGKKAIVLFTDGADNSSVLNAASAITRAKKAGVPVYSIAQGQALGSPTLLRELREISQATGGQTYRLTNPSHGAQIFQDISNDLKHTYLLSYKPPAAGDRRWRTIQVSVHELTGYKIRAREGYFPE